MITDTPPEVGSPWPEPDSDEIIVAVATHADAVEIVDGEYGAEKYAVLTVSFYRNPAVYANGKVVGHHHNPKYHAKIISRLPNKFDGGWLDEWKTHYDEEFKNIETALNGMSEHITYPTQKEMKEPRRWIQGFLNIKEGE